MLTIVRVWILLSAGVVGAGWILSACHQLNRTGYAVASGVAIAAVWWCKGQWPGWKETRRAGRKLLRRFKRPAPGLFLVLALLSLTAGALYVGVNGDSNAYRIPRVLHWLDQRQWHWIRTVDLRMNNIGCNFEWLSAPFILFTRADHLLFLANWISYLLLPGLVFSLFIRLGVRPRVAWWWMWLAASGWCFALQAGSDLTDSFAAIYALAAVDLALRARESKSSSDLWLSLLAAALLTGVKQIDIPLALLWLVAALPAARLLLARPAMTAIVVVWGLLVSAVPLTFFNLEHQGTWTGLAKPDSGLSLDTPFWGIVGNTFCLPAQNLMPPLFPWADAWNATMERFVQTPFGAHFNSFEQFGCLSRLKHGIAESNAGIGLCLCLLIAVSILAAPQYRRRAPAGTERRNGLLIRWLRILPWPLLLLFMAEVRTYENARHLAPYYLFLFPSFLIRPGHDRLVYWRWWQQLGLLIMLGTVMLLVVSRSRPLLPAQTLLGWLHPEYPQSKLIARAMFSFNSRSAVFEAQREAFSREIPPAEAVIGYATSNGGAEPGLWWPLGCRRVERVLPDDTPEQLQLLGIHFVVLDDAGLALKGKTLDEWLKLFNGELIDQMVFKQQPNQPGSGFYLVRLHRQTNAIARPPLPP